MEENEAQQQNDERFEFDDEDFYDDDMTEEEIAAEEQAQQQREQNARPLINQLEKDAATFYRSMLETPNFERFPATSDKTWYNAYYHEDLSIGGGSIFAQQFYYGVNHAVKNPGPNEFRSVLNRGKTALESGKTAVGGYYYIKNIQKKNPNTAGEFLDV